MVVCVSRGFGPPLLKSLVLASLLLSAGLAQAQLYWRGEIGYSSAVDANIRDKNFAQDGVICGNAICNTAGELNDVGESWLVGGGVGWRFSPNVRGDVTVSYRGGYELDDSDAFPNSAFNADITSWNVMANGYYEFTLPWGRPYIGAGVGWASNEVDDIVNTIGGVDFTVPGGTQSDVAWALMAGVGIQINPNLTLDIGYRYVDLGKIESDSGDVTAAGVSFGTYSGMEGKLRAHELMIGLRF